MTDTIISTNGHRPRVPTRVITEIADVVGEQLANEIQGSDSYWNEDSKDQLALELINKELARRDTAIVAAGGQGIPAADYAYVSEAVLDAVSGLSGYGPLIRNPDLRDIHGVGAKSILHTRTGERMWGPDIADDPAQALRSVLRLKDRCGYKGRFDESSPSMNLTLPGGGRAHVILAEHPGVVTTIRLHDPGIETIDEWFAGSHIDHQFAPTREAQNTFPATIEGFTSAASISRSNVVAAGSVGFGKTAFTRAYLNAADPWDRIIVIEDQRELMLSQYPHRHHDVVELLAKPPNIQGAGEIPIRFWVKEALRMNYDRLVVGECRGAETADMLSAMSAGKGGSITTIHALTPESTISRLRTLAAQNSDIANLDSRALDEWIASTIDLVFYLERGHRFPRVVEVYEIEPSLSSTGRGMQTTTLWRDEGDGSGCRPVHRPSKSLQRRLRNIGYPVEQTWGGQQL